MKKNIKRIIIAVVIIVVGVSIFLLSNYLIHKNDCCSCCKDGDVCIAMCCKCKGTIFK